MFCPSNGPVGADCDRIQILSRDPSASLPPCTCGVVGNWLIVKRLDRYHMFLADMQSQHLGDGKFWEKSVGTLRWFDDLFIDPTADFIL